MLCISNLKASKGIQDVIEAASILCDRGVTDFEVQIVGAWRSERFKTACERAVDEGDLPVVFNEPAFGEDKLRFLADADIFGFTPREPEGHPWVIVEALAAGLPIVSTDQGAIRESVLDGVNGYLVESSSPNEIADRLQRLIEDRDLRDRFGAASRSHYEAHFTEERMVASLSDAIESVLSEVQGSVGAERITPIPRELGSLRMNTSDTVGEA